MHTENHDHFQWCDTSAQQGLSLTLSWSTSWLQQLFCIHFAFDLQTPHHFPAISVAAIKGCKRQVLVDLVVIAINKNNNLRSLDQIHIYALYSQVIAVIPTNLKFILIICFRALNPHSPFSPSSSKTWKRRIFKTIFIKSLFKVKLFKIHTSHTCPPAPLCSLQSNVWLCPVLQFYSFLVLLKKWECILSVFTTQLM